MCDQTQYPILAQKEEHDKDIEELEKDFGIRELIEQDRAWIAS